MERPLHELKRRARSRYLPGLEPPAIAAELGLDAAQVAAWAAAGRWAQRRRVWFSDPRGAAATLRELLGRRVEELAAGGLVGPKEADELAKIGATCARLEKEGYDLKAAAVEVCERLAALAAEQETDPQRLTWLAGLLDRFFCRLVEEG
ncbi:MAG: hypothetical protein C4525_14900 [Desulfarculus sp.]|nr:MAG: hypothetical protein C4525_14900 [Desulfarculus sp.]